MGMKCRFQGHIEIGFHVKNRIYADDTLIIYGIVLYIRASIIPSLQL